MSYLPGAQLRISIPVINADDEALVDPAALEIHVRPPAQSALPAATYSWNGATWTPPDPDPGYAVPSKAGVGEFELTITVPYANTTRGRWGVGWKHTANVAGAGEGSGEVKFLVEETVGLPPAP